MTNHHKAISNKRLLTSLLLVFCFVFSTFAAWKNNPPRQNSPDKDHPIFGTHDWIAWEGYKLAKDDVDLTWIQNNPNMFFIGTEAPDNPLFPGVLVENSGDYNDQSGCHCVGFNRNGTIKHSKAERRVKEEFEKIKRALAADRKDLAAFYAGAMAHYLGDLSQFMHMMNSFSYHTDNPDTLGGNLHGSYEQAVESTIQYNPRGSLVFSTFISPLNNTQVTGDTPEKIAIDLAWFVETGGTDGHNASWMLNEYKTYGARRIKTTPSKWNEEFLNQSGKNINQAANAIAKILKILMQQ